MNIKEISEESFENCAHPTLFRNILTDRKFGIVSKGTTSFKLGWQSNLIKPIVKEINSQVYAIGIDRNFAIIDLVFGDIIMKIDLFYFFYDLYVYEGFVFVITELEIIILDRINYLHLTEVPLPEFYKRMEVNGQYIKFICVDGSEVDFNLCI